MADTRLQCYVGKKRLEKVIGLYKQTVLSGANDSFHITWHPFFYLDPTLPATGIERARFLASRYGPEVITTMNQRLFASGESEGINFDFTGKIGNTRDAHRLVQLAKKLENSVVEQLFRDHHEGGADVTSLEALLAAGEKAGLDRAETKAWLEQGRGGDEVDREVQQATRKGVHGVPFFTINDGYHLEGAQPAEAFVKEFVRAKQSAPAVSGDSSKRSGC